MIRSFFNRLFLALFSLVFTLFLFPVRAFAQDVADLPPDQFLKMIMDYIHSMAGLPFPLKVSGIVLLVIASMKVSFLRPFWDKLGGAKAFAVPVLSLIVGVIGLAPGGHLSFSGLLSYLIAGSGALLLHELLDALKSVPGLGHAYVAIIDLLMGLLGGADAKADAERAKLKAL